jgi:hypothetical protein
MVPFAASKDAEIIDDFANSEALLGQAVAVLVAALGGWPWDGTTPQRSITNATRADRDIVLRRAGCGCNMGSSRAYLLNAAMRLHVMLVSGAAGAGEPQQALSHATQGCASPPPLPCRVLKKVDGRWVRRRALVFMRQDSMAATAGVPLFGFTLAVRWSSINN